MRDPKTPEKPQGDLQNMAPGEKALVDRLETRFNRHKDDKLMVWLKRTTGRYLLDKLRSGVSP